jgi:hypothetical protein
MNFTGMLGGFAAEHAITGVPLGTYFNQAFSLVQFSDPDSGDAENCRLRIPHRDRLELPRRQRTGRYVGRRPGVDA